MATAPHPHPHHASAAAHPENHQHPPLHHHQPPPQHHPQQQTPPQTASQHPPQQPTPPPNAAQTHNQPQQIPPPMAAQTQQQLHGGAVRLMCSFGGKIYPRPHDNELRYVGGETRIVAVNRGIGFASLLAKLCKLPGAPPTAALKYQLPNEDLDALISVANDEDVENMMDEYDRLASAAPTRATAPRLRVFLFPPPDPSRPDPQHQNWFVDALNGALAGRLERARSEVSSTVSEVVPDYLFGLDSISDAHTDGEPPVRPRGSEPASPVHPNPVTENQPVVQEQPLPEPVHGSIRFSQDSNWPPQYAPQPFPVYYLPGPFCQPVQLPVVPQNPVQPGLVYVGGSSSLGGHYGLLPPVMDGFEPVSMLPVYSTVGVEPAVVTTAVEACVVSSGNLS